MKILFLSLGRYWTIKDSEGYTDLLREFIRHGDQVYIVSPTERREGKETQVIEEDNCTILKVKTGNIQKTNILEKGISTILIESQFLRAIKKYFKGISFDLVLYPTPPITFVKVVEYIKKRDNAKTYLLLKDIFPQNAVDIGVISTEGFKGIIYKYFRNKEKKLYSISDTIGCMSQANVKYVLNHNPEIDAIKVEICPNVVEILDKSINEQIRNSIRRKYKIPLDKTVFIYGGNLGKPQGIPFLINCVRQFQDDELYFLVVGDGTEYDTIANYINTEKPNDVKLMKRLPKEDYDTLVASCDVGLIFLDHRFTIPNFPSRMLGYMLAKVPVFACTDNNTDIGAVIKSGDYGWWCESKSAQQFEQIAKKILSLPRAERQKKGDNGFIYLTNNYSVEIAYKTIRDRIEEQK